MQIKKTTVPNDFGIVEKCINWNSERYNQEFNYELCQKLLLEETSELFQTDNIVDKLDAVGDIAFVAIGVLWKAGLPVKEIEVIFYDVSVYYAQGWQAVNSFMQAVIGNYRSFLDNSKEYSALSLALTTTFTVGYQYLLEIGMEKEFYNIVDIICRSNDTKEVKGKTPAHIKANINKGDSYIPPTVELSALAKLYNKI